jgi:hypothetical protein
MILKVIFPHPYAQVAIIALTDNGSRGKMDHKEEWNEKKTTGL